MVVDVASTICPSCSGSLHRIGEDVAERLDIVPAQFRVLVVRRPKYACRSCEAVVVQAAAPARLIEGGLPTEATVAQVLVSKYADHLPLYRPGVDLRSPGRPSGSLDIGRLGRTRRVLLRPVHERLLDRLKASSKLFADETTAPVLDPGRGQTKTGQLFAYARDDRPWSGPDPPIIAYVYAPVRKAARPIAHDAETAHQTWRHVADQLRSRWPKLAVLMDDSEHDVLAYMTFPAQHRTKLHSTNPLERLNKEVKRRADVVGIFPNDASIARPIGAVLLEQNDEWLLQHRYMQIEGMAELTPPLIDADPAKLPPLPA
jgi:transposase